MQICAASRQLACQVDLNPAGAANDAHQLAFCLYGATTNATPLGYVLHALNSFPGHLRNKGSSLQPEAGGAYPATRGLRG